MFNLFTSQVKSARLFLTQSLPSISMFVLLFLLSGNNSFAQGGMVNLDDDLRIAHNQKVVSDQVEYTPDTFSQRLESLESDISLFPNPAREEVNISFSSGEEPDKVVLYSVTGEKVREFSKEASAKLNLEQLSPGLYIVRVKAGNRYFNKKLRIL